MSDGSIGGGKYRRRRPLFSFFDNVFDCGGALSSSNCGRHRRGLVVSSSRGGVLLDPDGNNDEDDDDRSHPDYLARTVAGGEDHHRASTPIAAAVGHRRGLRLLCVDTGGWIRIAYADDDPVNCAAVVR